MRFRWKSNGSSHEPLYLVFAILFPMETQASDRQTTSARSIDAQTFFMMSRPRRSNEVKDVPLREGSCNKVSSHDATLFELNIPL